MRQFFNHFNHFYLQFTSEYLLGVINIVPSSLDFVPDLAYDFRFCIIIRKKMGVKHGYSMCWMSHLLF